MYFQNFFLDLIINFFDFFTMELFATTFFPYSHPYRKKHYRYAFLGANFLFALIPNIPYFTFISLGMCFCYAFLISNYRIKDSLIFVFRFQVFFYIFYTLSFFVCAFFNFNAYTLSTEAVFFDYQTVAATMLEYISLNLYINTKRLKALNIKTHYPITFSLLSTGIVFLLLFFNNMLSKYNELTHLLPWLYLSFVGILVFSLGSYRHIIDALEEQMKQKMLVEKYEMELSYFSSIQDSLDSLSRLRHDFKNHLIVLDSYAEQNRLAELRDYIDEITLKLTHTKLISTPNALISSILNTKNAVCQKQNITFLTNCEFDEIYISDFAIITILGNILDNAITASSQTPNGFIELNLLQQDGYFTIFCQNNHAGNIHEANGTFISTKTDQSTLHGLGISNIRKCVDNLQGSINITYDNKQFTVEILLPNHGLN